MRRNIAIVIIILTYVVQLTCDQWPLSASNTPDLMTSAFGPRKLSGHYDFHRGIDLSANNGTSVYPCHTGSVVYNPDGGSSGMLIVIQGTTHSTIYCHLSQSYVDTGDEISDINTVIGLSGNSGCNEYHLHLGYCHSSSWNNVYAFHPLEVLNFTDNSNPIPFLCEGNDYYDWTTCFIIEGDELDIDYMYLTVNFFEPPEYVE